jgi:uncharacterized ferritin-like protein (DUF455 family)
MFQLARVTISTHYRQLCGSCGTDKAHVFLRLVTKMKDPILEQRVNIKFCVKLGNNEKNYACNVVLKANAEICNGNNRHIHHLRKCACRNHK